MLKAAALIVVLLAGGCLAQPFLTCSAWVGSVSGYDLDATGCQVGVTTYLARDVTFGTGLDPRIRNRRRRLERTTSTSSSTTTVPEAFEAWNLP